MSSIERAALEELTVELAEESRRKKIDREKERLRKRLMCPWYVKLFPWRIKIERVV